MTMPHGTPASFRSCSSASTSGSCGRTARDALRYHATSSSCGAPMPGHSLRVRAISRSLPARPVSSNAANFAAASSAVVAARTAGNVSCKSPAGRAYRCRHGPRACCRGRRARRRRRAAYSLRCYQDSLTPSSAGSKAMSVNRVTPLESATSLVGLATYASIHIPAARAAWTPASLSSMTTQSDGANPIVSAAWRNT